MKDTNFETLSSNKLFLHCAIPAMLGGLISALYSIADGIFVGHFIGKEALAAVNLAIPFIMIISALADMVAAGSSVRISILLEKGILRRPIKPFPSV